MEIKEAIQLLELTVPLSKGALKKAYRDALMVWHPDRFTGNTELKTKAEGRTYQINEAYALLSRIPESDYPYRASAGCQQAKRPPPANPKQANAGPSQQAKPPGPQPSSPPQRPATAPPPKQSKATLAKKKAAFLTIAAWVICVPAGAFLIAFIVFAQLQSFDKSSNVVTGGIAYQEMLSAPIKEVLPTPITRTLPQMTIEEMRIFEPQLSIARKTLPTLNLSIEEMQVKSRQGDMEAQHQLGKAYANGYGVVKDEKEAVKWFQSAADQRYAAAQLALARCYFIGKGVSKDAGEALNWCRKAAEQGDPESQYILGWHLANGAEVAQDAVEAVKWFYKAAVQGSYEAQCRLSSCYLSGIGVPKDQTKGEKWGLIAAATKNGEFDKLPPLTPPPKVKGVIVPVLPKAVYNGIGWPWHPKDKDTVDPVLRHLPSDERLTSGSILIDQLKTFGGKGKLTLDNGLTEDAYVKLISGDKLCASFYVRGGEKFTFNHMPDNIYHLIYCTGYGWNTARRDFARGRHAVRYDEPLSYSTTRRTEGNTIISSIGMITLTLHKVANGNTSTSDISLEEFDRY